MGGEVRRVRPNAGNCVDAGIAARGAHGFQRPTRLRSTHVGSLEAPLQLQLRKTQVDLAARDHGGHRVPPGGSGPLASLGASTLCLGCAARSRHRSGQPHRLPPRPPARRGRLSPGLFSPGVVLRLIGPLGGGRCRGARRETALEFELAQSVPRAAIHAHRSAPCLAGLLLHSPHGTPPAVLVRSIHLRG